MDDIYAMDGPRFFRLAWRIAAYGGMVKQRIELQNMQPPEGVVSDAMPSASRPAGVSYANPHALAVGRVAPGTRVLPLSAMALENGDLFQMSRVESPPAQE